MTAGAIRAPTIVPLRPPQVGKPKTTIDTQVKVELSTDTPETDIFFTINGTKPEPFQTTGQRSTYRYKTPFALPSGKRTIKAIAVAKDGTRESNVVTKTFDVEFIKTAESLPRGEGDTYGFIDELRDQTLPKTTASGMQDDTRRAARSYIRKLLKSTEAWGEEEGNQQHKSRVNFNDKKDSSPSHRKMGGARFLESRMSKSGIREVQSSDGEDHSLERPKRSFPENSTQAMRIQRETDFLKCVYCLAPRPTDPFCRFCTSCGNTIPPLPQTRLPPPESGQLGMCVHCRSMVPMNVPTCLVCEAPMHPQNQPQASMRLRDRLLCGVCGTANPSHIEACLTCEARLPLDSATVSIPQHVAPVSASQSLFPPGALLGCGQCGRQNNPDARYCDWCGAKPTSCATVGQLSTIGSASAAGPGGSGIMVCTKCSAHNQASARFCGQCAGPIEPPARLMPGQISSNWLPITLPLGGSVAGLASPAGNPGLWRKGLACDATTQTVGLFYPSTTQMRRKETEEDEKAKQAKEMRDRAPLLTVVSPGKGYWRKQIDHIIAHLKVHGNNNAEFRALIGEPRMGKLLSSSVHEDGYELTMNLTFALKDYKDPYRGQPMGSSQYLSAMTKGRANSIDSYRSDDTASIASTAGSRRRPIKKKAKKMSTRRDQDVLSIPEKALIRLLGKNGEGRASEIMQSLEEGASATCTNKDGVPALILAVRNKHKEAIPVLAQSGADVNMPGPDKGNTPLHEAVLLGLDGEEVLNALLGCGANVQKKNDKGDTPYALAVTTKCDPIIKKLASRMGQAQLDRMIQPRQDDDEDDDI